MTYASKQCQCSLNNRKKHGKLQQEEKDEKKKKRERNKTQDKIYFFPMMTHENDDGYANTNIGHDQMKTIASNIMAINNHNNDGDEQ